LSLTVRVARTVDPAVACEIDGEGKIKAANGDKATFKLDVESGAPPKGKLRYQDYGPAAGFKLRSIEITEVTVSADQREASIVGKAKIKKDGTVDFRVDVKDLPGALDTFRIRLSDYDSGEQQIHDGDVDVECDDDD
jgi:hypothetical protein